jgi:ribosomal protein L12E/L44/L45/RPP1/RPP2
MTSINEVAKGIAGEAIEEFERTVGQAVGTEMRERLHDAAEHLALAQLQRLAGQNIEEAQKVATARIATIAAAGSQIFARALVSSVHLVLVRGLERIVAAAL